MTTKFSARDRVKCGVIAVAAGLVYIGFSLVAISGAWQRGEGDLPAVAPWFENVGLAVVAFPFGFVPGFDSILIAPLINTLFWSFVAGVICAWVLRRRIANPSRSGEPPPAADDVPLTRNFDVK